MYFILYAYTTYIFAQFEDDGQCIYEKYGQLWTFLSNGLYRTLPTCSGIVEYKTLFTGEDPKRDICPTHVHICQPNISQCEIVRQLRFYMLIPIQFPILLFECRPRRLSNFLTHTTNLHNNTHTTTNPHNKRLSWGTVWMTFSGST